MSQQSPFNLEKNIVIRACAGAGKTYTLTWRYIVILDYFAKLAKNTSEKNWLGPANILAITFTNKATAELRSRILKTLNSLLSNSISNLPVKIDNLVNSDLKYINWLKRQLLKPSIMTIDSFCTSIIKDYPNFSGVDSSVKIMDDYESKEFYGQCFKQFFKTINPSQIKFIALKLGAKNIQPIFIDALNNQSQLIKLISKYNLNENEILKFWMKNYQIDFDFSRIVQKTFNGAKLIIESELPIDIKNEWDELYEISKKILSSEKVEQNDLFRNKLKSSISIL